MKKLITLSDAELEKSLDMHVKQERGILHIILEHIKEVSRRELHLARGYGSLKDYLVKVFGYSERAAYRRIEAANLLKQVPTLVENIKNGSIDITKIEELTRAVKEKERVSGEKVTALVKSELVARISGKTSMETQKELAQILDIKVKEYDVKKMQKDESVRVEFTLTREQYEKIQKCQDLAAHKIQQERMDFSLASVVEILADTYLAGKTHTNSRQANSSNIQKEEEQKASASLERVNKTLTPKTKKEVLNRDQCCQYRDLKTGKICGSTFALQVDHKTSQWANGSHALSNLQVLCANHNRYKYRQESQLQFL
ncbi:HNH endonuclease signature motif containing protein [Bdellovibrio sp. HCB2-146]|uniref:HNH endonuclease signature motif containing protein n=1 Tax=Bdellovibrio sp. HCB2-146 TaxID=3394362 RepID=UPI0039BC7F58